MGLSNIDEISARLIEAGLPASTPAAAIQDGATAQQKRLITSLDALGARARAAGLEPPVLFVIGKVVSMVEVLDWFEPASLEASDARNQQSA